MKKYWKTVGIIALAAGALYYPAMKLFKYIAKKRAGALAGEEGEHYLKAFSPAYRGKHHPHHRHPNGHSDHDSGLA